MDTSPLNPNSAQARQAWIDKSASLLGLNWDQLPHMPAWGPLFGFTEEWHRAVIVQATGKAALVLGRPLESTERDAMATTMATNNVSLAYSPLYWMPAALLFERMGRKRFRFPFYTPTIDPLRFPSQRFALVSGPTAVWSWHLSRLTCYTIMSKLLIAPVVAAMVTFNTYQALVWNPNLAAFHEAMKKLNVKEARRLEQRLDQTLAAIYDDPDDASMRDASTPYFRQEEQAQEGTTVPGNSWSRYRQMASKQATPGQQSQTQPQETSWAPEPPRSPSDMSSGLDDDTYIFDDASPVAPTVRPQQNPAAPPTPSGGSAWERLRKGAQPGTDNSTPQQPSSQIWAQRRFQASQQARQGQAGQDNQDAYAYSKDEQEKEYAKAQAQREFDALLERERRSESDDGERRR